MKFESKYINFHPRKFIHLKILQNGDHFVGASMCWFISMKRPINHGLGIDIISVHVPFGIFSSIMCRSGCGRKIDSLWLLSILFIHRKTEINLAASTNDQLSHGGLWASYIVKPWSALDQKRNYLFQCWITVHMIFMNHLFAFSVIVIANSYWILNKDFSIISNNQINNKQ